MTDEDRERAKRVAGAKRIVSAIESADNLAMAADGDVGSTWECLTTKERGWILRESYKLAKHTIDAGQPEGGGPQARVLDLENAVKRFIAVNKGRQVTGAQLLDLSIAAGVEFDWSSDD